MYVNVARVTEAEVVVLYDRHALNESVDRAKMHRRKEGIVASATGYPKTALRTQSRWEYKKVADNGEEAGMECSGTFCIAYGRN